jgi:ABC-type lipoprotein export system ATPase subunit
MNFKIKELHVENFKAFRTSSFKFKSENLSILDGPNGFGKTSLFDALELVFLGKVQRYIDIEQQTTYGRKTDKPYPLMFDRAKPSDRVAIELILELDSGEFITLKRMALCSTLMNLKVLDDAVFKLELFKNGNKINFNDEVEVLTWLLGGNYQNNYSLFHYIEQEENISLLKNKDIDKHAKMDHLFDVADYRKKIDKVVQVRKAIRPLRTDKKNTQLQNLYDEITELEKSLTLNNEVPITYTRLIHSSKQPWDQEGVQFDAGSYAHWLGENGELNSIAELKRAEVDFVNDLHNEDIKRYLSLKPKAVEPLLRFGRLIEKIPRFQLEIILYDDAQDYLQQIEGEIINMIVTGKSLPSESICLKLKDKIDFKLMEKNAADIQSRNSDSNKLSQSLNNLISKRKVFLSEFNNYQSLHPKKETSCPTCGFDWQEFDLLEKQFETQAQSLMALVEGQGAILYESLELFKKNFLDKISSECLLIVEEQKVSIEYKKSICSLSEKQLHFLTNLKKKYSEYGIELIELYAKSFTMDEKLKTPQLIEMVSSKYKPVNGDVLKPEYNDLFKAIFNNSEEELNKFNLNELELKISYIKQKFAASRVKEIKQKKKDYLNQKYRFDEANKLEKNLRKLVDLYNDNVDEYISSISKGIEIMFHIYSGRLLQNFHNGLGVFIEADGRSVSFRDTPQSKHDVIFIMSSGQLSSLIIAFTLALNKKYAKNNLLLIDDPVQTMDDINVAGFIDILRREFKNRQIVISTHEDHTSSYFRYKFKKAGLDQERINLYELNK